jgi:hypothetical protein
VEMPSPQFQICAAVAVLKVSWAKKVVAEGPWVLTEVAGEKAQVRVYLLLFSAVHFAEGVCERA